MALMHWRHITGDVGQRSEGKGREGKWRLVDDESMKCTDTAHCNFTPLETNNATGKWQLYC